MSNAGWNDVGCGTIGNCAWCCRQISIIYFFFCPPDGDWRHGPSLNNDDVPYAILGLSTDESLGKEASAQEVDTPEPLLALNLIQADTLLECPKYFHLPKSLLGLILTALDCRAKVEIDREQDVLDGDDGIPRGIRGIWPDCTQPGKVTNAKCQGGQRRARGGCGENSRGQTWVRLGGVGTHIVQQVWRGERGMDVHV